MKKLFYLAVVAIVVVAATSCDNEKCWKVTGTWNGVPGEWYEDGTKTDVEKDCREKDIKDYTITEANEYTEKTCPETLDIIPDKYDD